ncbi:ParB N-terminal domain-containing protein [Bacillus cereus]|uniref:ParB N-terminal domain-containing protein n=1 Tax=Bacillus cereus TaxID=1396 RepID=UPI0039C39A78
MDILSRLRLVDIDQIYFHEPVEPRRLKRTCQAIEKEGVIRHPVIATILSPDRYLILDGAHRTQSLQQLGYNKIPIQLVDATEIKVEAWEHLVPEGLWLEQLQENTILQWTNTLRSEFHVAEMIYTDRTRFWVYPNHGIDESCNRLEVWNYLVELYTRTQSVIRLPQGRYSFPGSNHVLLRFPTLTLEEIKKIVLAEQLVPAGVTRCIVQGRLLNLNIPLFLLNSTNKTNEWAQFCEQKVDKLRLYTESIYLCEV